MTMELDWVQYFFWIFLLYFALGADRTFVDKTKLNGITWMRTAAVELEHMIMAPFLACDGYLWNERLLMEYRI